MITDRGGEIKEMSISLNNHEQRITALENKLNDQGSGGIKYTHLGGRYTVSIGTSLYLDQPANNFDMLFVNYRYSYFSTHPNGKKTVSFGQFVTTSVASQFILGDSVCGYLFEYTGDFTAMVTREMFETGNNGLAQVINVWGLKLYYNFSYNIYNVKVVRIVKKLINFFKYHLLSSNFYF